MTETDSLPAIDTADPDDWAEAVEALYDELGHAEPLGRNHRALFSDQGTTLLVSFERQDDIIARGQGRLPAGLTLAHTQGWSHLGIVADGPTWWRDRAVWRYFDRLVDDAFFEDFDRVVFFGAGPGGYAAAAYSVVAPGATVLAVAPQATLTPLVAGWDRRYPAARRLDFTARYGFAPDMTEGAGRTFVIFDPAEREDAMHAALFFRPWVTLLRARHLGQDTAAALARIGVLDDLVIAAAEGRLTPALFADALRRRRADMPYLRRMLYLTARAGRPAREAMICRSVTGRMSAPMFRARLAELDAGQ